MEKRISYYRMDSMIKKSLTEFEMKFKSDSTYLNSKLQTADDDQKVFYEFFLSPENPKAYIERYYGLFTATTLESEDYESLKYYINNLIYFSPFESS